jgi:hypothetical protein
MSEQHLPHSIPKRRTSDHAGDPYKYADSKIEILEMDIAQKFDSISIHCKRIEAMINRYASGFPDDDPEGHRKAHESLIRRNERISALCDKLLFEIAKWGLLGLLGWVIYAMGHEIVSTFRGVK